MGSTRSDELIERNITPAFDLAKNIVANPALLDEIPDGATVVLIPQDDPELAERNSELGIEAVRAGEANASFRRVRAGAVTS